MVRKLFTSTLVCACSFAAFGQQPPKPSSAAEAATKAPDNTIITSLTLESVQKVLQGMGFECTRGKDAQGKLEAYVTFRAEGYKVAAFVPDESFLELYNSFTDVNPTPVIVNEWNLGNRFSRAYVDKDGNATLEDDLIVSGGVTRDNIEMFIKTFRDTVARWARFTIDHNKGQSK